MRRGDLCCVRGTERFRRARCCGCRQPRGHRCPRLARSPSARRILDPSLQKWDDPASAIRGPRAQWTKTVGFVGKISGGSLGSCGEHRSFRPSCGDGRRHGGVRGTDRRGHGGSCFVRGPSGSVSPTPRPAPHSRQPRTSISSKPLLTESSNRASANWDALLRTAYVPRRPAPASDSNLPFAKKSARFRKKLPARPSYTWHGISSN